MAGPRPDPTHLETDVLVVGGGGAGMFAAVAAARNGAQVLLIDKNVVGRGGATIMAQMTCASALGEEEPDGPEQHLADTLEAGRGLCNENLSALLCENSPKRIRELEGWKVQWARQENGKIRQVLAPGHSRKRCVYVDFLKTGAAIAAALRNQTSRNAAIRRLSNVSLTDLVTREGAVIGATGIDIATAAPVVIRAPAVILCLGGMTKMFRRTTAPNNIAGEGLGLALRAGARLIDIEFLQFYPNGHMAPRMVGLDPTTWEPTRVKLGGRLLNGDGDEFLHKYGEAGGDGYNTTRDTLTHAMYKEVEAGRGSPHGGVYLSFQHIDPAALEAALGPFLEIFHRNNIDLTKRPVEVYPIAHYQMGGVEVDTDMATGVPSPTTRWAASRSIPTWQQAFPASTRRASWPAAPMAPTGCRATPCPRPWCSASEPVRRRPSTPRECLPAPGTTPTPHLTSTTSRALSAAMRARASRRHS
jgi:succinate dehydrogenase/fumarate reductase flavoprotein subunit